MKTHRNCFGQTKVFDIKFIFNKIVAIINIEDKLLTQPKTTYELELGKERELDLGKYQADSDIVFTSYGVLCWLPNLNDWAKTIFNS